jgi:callose synthase
MLRNAEGLRQAFREFNQQPVRKGRPCLGTDPRRDLRATSPGFLTCESKGGSAFSAAWNEIIDHLRQEDIISNTESDNLKFSQFDGFSQAIYLPFFSDRRS